MIDHETLVVQMGAIRSWVTREMSRIHDNDVFPFATSESYKLLMAGRLQALQDFEAAMEGRTCTLGALAQVAGYEREIEDGQQ